MVFGGRKMLMEMSLTIIVENFRNKLWTVKGEDTVESKGSMKLKWHRHRHSSGLSFCGSFGLSVETFSSLQYEQSAE